VTSNEFAFGLRAVAGPVRWARPLLLSLLISATAFPTLANDAGTLGSALTAAPAALRDPTPMAARSLLFSADIGQLAISQPVAARPEPEPEVSERARNVLRRATALLGTPYRWGGTSNETGFDCSGLVGYVFKSALGIDLPRVSRDMAQSGERVERTAISAGDLVFFSRRGKRVDHVGIYVGNGKFLHAPRTGKDVMLSPLETGYWAGKFMQARRVADI